MLVHLLVPEKKLYSGPATFVSLRTGNGDIAFLANHAPFIGNLETCVVKIEREDSPNIVAAVHGGFVKVSNSEVYVLASVAELADDIDIDRARDALQRTTDAISAVDDPATQRAMKSAQIRIDVASLALGTGV